MDIVTSSEKITKAFTEWERQYRENPEEFMNALEKAAIPNAETYGELVTPFFIQLLGE